MSLELTPPCVVRRSSMGVVGIMLWQDLSAEAAQLEPRIQKIYSKMADGRGVSTDRIEYDRLCEEKKAIQLRMARMELHLLQGRNCSAETG